MAVRLEAGARQEPAVPQAAAARRAPAARPARVARPEQAARPALAARRPPVAPPEVAAARARAQAGAPTVGPAGTIVATQPLSPNIVVDQFGYRPSDEKIAVIRNPQKGFDATATFTPGAKYALVDAHSGAKLLEAAPTQWNGGATDSSSGDKAWWFDFSTVTTAGDYFVLDETKTVRSDVFSISNGVYRDVLTQATRMLFYQRDGFAKTAQYAGAAWADGAAHTGKCYLYSDTTKTLNQDLHGGWWDAGDFNKYTNWGASDVIELMHAYAETPAAFTDATNIPESGNGVADLLDEVKWELDWLGRMQQSNGSVLSIVGEAAADGARLRRLGQHRPLDGDRPLRLRPGLDVGLAHRRRRLRLRRGRLRRGGRRQHRLPRLRRRPRPAGAEGLDLGAGEPGRLLLQLDGEPHRRRRRAGGPDRRLRPRLRAPGQAAPGGALPLRGDRRPPATATSSTRTTRRSTSSPPATPTARTARSRRRCSPTRRRRTRPPPSSPRSRPRTWARCRPAATWAPSRPTPIRTWPTSRAATGGGSTRSRATRGTCSTTSSPSRSIRRPAPRPPRAPSATSTTSTA